MLLVLRAVSAEGGCHSSKAVWNISEHAIYNGMQCGFIDFVP
jgi:hypothetical protein